MEEKKTKVESLKELATKKNLLITALVVFFTAQFIQVQSILGTFSFLEGRDTSLLTEVGQVKNAYVDFAADLNEMRSFLRLPAKSYGVLDQLEDFENSEGENEDELQLALFNYLDYLTGQKRLESRLGRFGEYFGALEGEAFAEFFKKEGFFLAEVSDTEGARQLKVMAKNGEEDVEMLSFYLDKETGEMWMKSVKAKEALQEDELEDFVLKVKQFLAANTDEIKEMSAKLKALDVAVDSAIASEAAVQVMEELGLELSEKLEADLMIKRNVMNKAGEVVGEIVIDVDKLKVRLVDLRDEDLSVEVSDVNKGLEPFLRKLDTQTFLEKKYQEAVAELEATLDDKGFKLVLEQGGYEMKEKREDDERVYFDIYEGERHLSSIVVEKATGVVNIVMPNGTNAENLLFFDPEFKKKTLDLPENLPDYSDDPISDDNSFNILIAGKHGSLVDTMIFAHINEERGDIRMISIPRDLFYNGRKINALAMLYGMPELKRVLSDLTGYELDKYILIDMYAFIEVVDLIGGIDITLTEPVVDPFYKTIDNGVEGTLHYEPGDYHLGGVEALRLARSRKTSSDFARASRQQLILEAIQDKARNFGFGDADTIYAIAKSVLKKTETDIDLDEAIAYYFRYQNYEIVSNDVMSSGNVLYVPPYITKENCEKLIAEASAAGQETPGCMDENQAYTLMPRDNNWDLIKWFFRENFAK